MRATLVFWVSCLCGDNHLGSLLAVDEIRPQAKRLHTLNPHTMPQGPVSKEGYLTAWRRVGAMAGLDGKRISTPLAVE